MFPTSPSPETFRCFSSGRSKGRMIYCSLPIISLTAWSRVHRQVTRGGKGYLCVSHFPRCPKMSSPPGESSVTYISPLRTGCDPKTIKSNAKTQCHLQRNSWIGRILEIIKLAAWISSVWSPLRSVGCHAWLSRRLHRYSQGCPPFCLAVL